MQGRRAVESLRSVEQHDNKYIIDSECPLITKFPRNKDVRNGISDLHRNSTFISHWIIQRTKSDSVKLGRMTSFVPDTSRIYRYANLTKRSLRQEQRHEKRLFRKVWRSCQFQETMLKGEPGDCWVIGFYTQTALRMKFDFQVRLPFLCDSSKSVIAMASIRIYSVDPFKYTCQNKSWSSKRTGFHRSV